MEFRKILEREADLEVVGEAKDGRQALSMAIRLFSAVILMDFTMPHLNGLEAMCRILKAMPLTKVLMLSAHSDAAYAEQGKILGAVGYLLKQTSAESVCAAIRAAHKGKSFLAH